MNEENEFEIQMNNRVIQTSGNSLWQELKNAIRGSDADYTQINLGKAVFLLAVPMILELIM